VVELGVSKPGEMNRLAWMVRPEYAVITNIGSSHLEFLRTEYGVAREKGKVLDYTSKAVFLNLDNRFRAMLKRPRLETVTVHASKRRADYRFESAVSRGYDGWTVRFAGRRMEFPLYGGYNLDNLAMASAVGRRLGVGPAGIAEAVGNFRYIGSRAFLLRGKNVLVVDESYNANYSSLSKSIRFLDRTATGGKKAVVIGEMKELGRRSRFLHGLIGQELTRTKIGRILLTGREARHIRRTCFPRKRVIWCANEKALAGEVLALKTAGDRLTILVKGSRSNRLDKIVDILKKKWRLK
jgi:UDP-N-acetylmuramoyl-tripeptide--D-alanyl-D-alanine ligase